MKCVFRPSADKRLYRCKRWRCTNTAKATVPPERVFAECKGWQVLPAPGDTLKRCIEIATNGAAHHGTTCDIERQRLNQLGWFGCWRDRVAICARLQREAAKEGVALTWRTAIGYAAKVTWKVVRMLV